MYILNLEEALYLQICACLRAEYSESHFLSGLFACPVSFYFYYDTHFNALVLNPASISDLLYFILSLRQFIKAVPYSETKDEYHSV